MNEIKDLEILRSYVCIETMPDLGFMNILDIVTTYEKAEDVCMKHMFKLAEDIGDNDLQIEHSLWKPMEQDTGVIMTYKFISEQTSDDTNQFIILFFDRDMKDIMKQLKDMSEAKCQPIITATQKDNPIKKFHDICNEILKSDITAYGGLIGPPSHPQNEYMEYNCKYLSTKQKGDELVPVLNMSAFKWGFPYMIMTNMSPCIDGRCIYTDDVVVTYGIAAYLSKDDSAVIFISTYDKLGDTMFGRSREIKVSVKDLCNRVKIKCVGMIEGGTL